MNKPIVPPNLRRLGQGELVSNGDYLLSEDDEFIEIHWMTVPELIDNETDGEFFTPMSKKTTEPSLNSSDDIMGPGDSMDTIRAWKYTLKVDEIDLNGSGEKALTNDEGKPALARLPWGALKEMAAVMSYGAQKYGSDRNYLKGMEYTRQVSCIMRHLVASLEGDDRDSESGELHAAHALTRCAFLVQNIVDGTVIDDRHTP